MLLGRNAWAIGDSERAFDAYRAAAALLPADPPSVELARILAEEARGLMLMSRYGEAEQLCQRALLVAAAVDARAEEGHLIYTLGICRGWLGHYDEGIELVRRSLAIAEELASPDDVNRAYMGLGALLMSSGRLEESAGLVFAEADPGEDAWGVRLRGAAGNSVEALIRLGRHSEAEELLARVGDRGVGTVTVRPSLLRAMLAIRTGRFDEAARSLSRGDELSPRLADVRVRGGLLMLSAEMALLQGRPGEAYASIERALDLASRTDDEELSCEMCALAARAVVDQFHEARSMGGSVDADQSRQLALGYQQQAERLARAPGRARERPRRGRRSSPPCARLSDPVCTNQTAISGPRQPGMGRGAGALSRGLLPLAGGGSAARGSSRARRWPTPRCARRGEWRWTWALVPLREQIERLAERARIPLQDPRADTAGGTGVSLKLGLTPRESEVLGHLAAGRTDREIADALFISKKTASVHVSNILRKLEVTNRIEAGKIGQANGLGYERSDFPPP